MDSKPIFIIRHPHYMLDGYNSMRDKYTEIQKNLYDYHVLLVADDTIERLEFEYYNSSHTEIEFEELKNIVLSKLFPNMYENTITPQPGDYGC